MISWLKQNIKIPHIIKMCDTMRFRSCHHYVGKWYWMLCMIQVSLWSCLHFSVMHDPNAIDPIVRIKASDSSATRAWWVAVLKIKSSTTCILISGHVKSWTCEHRMKTQKVSHLNQMLSRCAYLKPNFLQIQYDVDEPANSLTAYFHILLHSV